MITTVTHQPANGVGLLLVVFGVSCLISWLVLGLKSFLLDISVSTIIYTKMCAYAYNR